MVKQLTGEEDFNGLVVAEPTLPSHAYFDPAHHGHELRSIWYGKWVYLCRADTLAGPMSFRTFDIGTQNILVLRNSDDVLKAFHNTCRHRGSVICPEREGRLKSKLIVCPYHQWAYDGDGNLVRTSSLSQAPDFCSGDYGLYNVALTEWRGCVFVCLDQEPPSFEDSYGRDAGIIDNWPLETLVVGHTWRKTMACNWKVFWENFNECLHCPNIHPELSDLVPLYSRRVSQPRDDPDWQDHAGSEDPKLVGGLRGGAVSWTMDGAAAGHAFERLTDAERALGQAYFVSLPSVFIASHADYMRIVRILPTGPEETDLEVEWLFAQSTLDDPAFDLSRVVDFAVTVLEQDAAASELNQKGLRSIRHDHGVLMPEEHHVHRFQTWVRQAMAGN